MRTRERATVKRIRVEIRPEIAIPPLGFRDRENGGVRERAGDGGDEISQVSK